eukprot:CAMPEP_0172534116 /NCGR_PEP_ID=MMETSP1067-20121228/6601_1 /TAXON_ID=265564 ORGANISM="Thalassiosira punctigera, Strain Tpunct2005C2" /NCGR_SAMPLE_ID=MMETSP1067 /ASSEMBLY_ACC=CAM_ASM_000444 /LENGTH=30 /DNA_ID= /DNA_START= /DNA_END= /DNA_ORIENTATION=
MTSPKSNIPYTRQCLRVIDPENHDGSAEYK